LKNEKKKGECKNCFTKRRLSELEKEKMEKMIDEILISKKSKDKDFVKKTKDSDGTESVIEKLLLRNLEAVKKLADKEDIDIEKLLKQLKKGE
jgi:NMD protein affecting ribosome stability and mRNA decay